MQFKDFTKFIKKENGRLNTLYPFTSKRDQLFAYTIKFFEEAGELCNEILGKNKLVRKEKWANYTDETLTDEIADVLITTMLVAENLGVDVEKALASKMTKIDKRYNVR